MGSYFVVGTSVTQRRTLGGVLLCSSVRQAFDADAGVWGERGCGDGSTRYLWLSIITRLLMASFAVQKLLSLTTWTVNFQMFKLVLEKAEEPEIKLSTSAGSSKKQESSRKTSISALLTIPKPLTLWITINCGKFWKRREYQTTWPTSWETCMQVRKQQLELDMGQQTGSK